MASDRLVGSITETDVPDSLKEFAAQAFSPKAISQEKPVLIADGMVEMPGIPQTEDKPVVKPSETPVQLPDYGSTYGREKHPYPESWKQNPYPECLPKLAPYNPRCYTYQPGTPFCRRPYAPTLPTMPHPMDVRKAYRNPENAVVQSTMRIALELNQHPMMDSHPSEISRMDPSACFLNMILQRVVGRQSMGNTIEEIAFTLGDVRDPNHFYAHPVGQEQPGDIIIAYPHGGHRAEGAIYLGNGRVASYDPSTKLVTTTDSIKAFYPPKDSKEKPIYDKVVLYRWASWKSF